MNVSPLLLVCLTGLVQYSECKVSQCKLCTSDNGDNIPCEETPELQTSGACDPQYGNDYCYVLYTRNKKPTPGEMWNSEYRAVLIVMKYFRIY